MIWLFLLLFGAPSVPALLLLNIPIKGQRSGKRFWIAVLSLMALALVVFVGSWIGAAFCTGELCSLGYAYYGGGAALVLLLVAFIVAIVSKFVHSANNRGRSWSRSRPTSRN